MENGKGARTGKELGEKKGEGKQGKKRRGKRFPMWGYHNIFKGGVYFTNGL